MKLPRFTIFKRIALLVAITGLLSGCATSTLFGSYPSQINPIKSQVGVHDYHAAELTLASKAKGNALQLYGPELGRVQQFSGNFKASLATYSKVIDQVRHDQLQAKVRISHLLTDTSTLLTNDNAIPFTLSGYEIVYLYYYQALNYLGLHDLTNALVSVRRAISEQTYIKQINAEQLAAAQREARKKHLNFNPQDYKQFKQTMALASDVKNNFENGFGYYLGGILFAADGDLNNAIVSLRNALQVSPQNRYVQKKLLELMAEQGGYDGEIARDVKKFGLSQAPKIPENSGQLVVVYEQGFVKPKTQVTIPIPIPGYFNSQVQTFVFPAYQGNAPTPMSLSVSDDQQRWGNTDVVVRTLPLAAHSLKDHYPFIFIRAVLRLVAKAAMTHQANKQNGFAGLIAQIYSVVSNQADLRSWLTLPSNVQVLQHYAKPGHYKLLLQQSSHRQNVSVTLQSGKTTLLWVVDVGDRFIVHRIPIQ